MCSSISSSTASFSFQTAEELYEEKVAFRLHDVFSNKIPKFVEENREWIGLKENYFYCCLCNADIQTGVDYWTNENSFRKHLTSGGHVNALEYAEEACNPPDGTYEKFEETRWNNLTVLYGSEENIPYFVEDSIDYIGYSSGMKYYCYLCNKNLHSSEDESIILQQFESHLMSKGHRSNLYYAARDSQQNAAKLYCSQVERSLNALFKGSLPYFVESCIDYIDQDNGDYYCHLCDKCLQVSQDFSITVNNFKKHFLSKGHKYYLNKYVLKQPLTSSETYLDARDKILNIVFQNNIPYYVNNCIDYIALYERSFYCCICGKYMSIHERDTFITRKNCKSHLFSKLHKELLQSVV